MSRLTTIILRKDGALELIFLPAAMILMPTTTLPGDFFQTPWFLG
jgi:hypothetical protein